MLKIIPAIDIRDGKCVRLQQGDFSRQTIYSYSPIDAGKKWDALGAALIHIVDLDGAKHGRTTNTKTIGNVCSAVACPCELGGGIRTLEAVEEALAAGVSRVVFGTALAENPKFASALVKQFGSDAIVAGLDARNGEIAIEGWQAGSKQTPLDLAGSLFDHGVRNFIYTDISTDGMFTGPNLEAISELCDAIPNGSFIASGGVGSATHIEEIIKLERSNLYGVIVGKALYDGRVNYEELNRIVGQAKRPTGKA